jgi:hypothetical protein
MKCHALAAAAAALSIFGATPILGQELAVGAAAGYEVPPGYEIVPVFTRPNGPSWTPPDNSFGYTFREPVYATPKGYRYYYVRGYSLRRVVDADAPRVYVKKPRKVAGKSARRGPCVTDLGYGRHDYCDRY